MKRLPIVKNIDSDDDTDYYFDKRLGELRAVNDINNIIKLNEFQVYYYEHFYNEADKYKGNNAWRYNLFAVDRWLANRKEELAGGNENVFVSRRS